MWPEFETKQPLADGKSWIAKFDSFDQYREFVYYLIKVFDGEQLVAKLVAQLDSSSYQGSWTDAQQQQLTAGIAAVAASGESNTSYAGYNW